MWHRLRFNNNDAGERVSSALRTYGVHKWRSDSSTSHTSDYVASRMSWEDSHGTTGRRQGGILWHRMAASDQTVRISKRGRHQRRDVVCHAAVSEVLDIATHAVG